MRNLRRSIAMGGQHVAYVTKNFRLRFAGSSINELRVDVEPYSIGVTDIFRLTGSQVQHEMLSLRHGCRDLVLGGRIVPEEHSFHLGLTDYLSVNRDLRLICLAEAVRAVEVDPGLVGAERRQCAFDAAELRRRCTADQEERRKYRSN